MKWFFKVCFNQIWEKTWQQLRTRVMKIWIGVQYKGISMKMLMDWYDNDKIPDQSTKILYKWKRKSACSLIAISFIVNLLISCTFNKIFFKYMHIVSHDQGFVMSLAEIIQLNICPEFLSFIYVIFYAKAFSNYIKHLLQCSTWLDIYYSYLYIRLESAEILEDRSAIPWNRSG